MAAASDPTVSEIFKVVYGDAIAEVVPKSDLLARDIPFVKMSQREGEEFRQPVQLSREAGFTVNSDFTAFALNDAEASVEKQASVNGAEILLRSQLSYAYMQKALHAAGQGARAFKEATKFKVANMLQSMSFMREIQTLYGSGPATSDTFSCLGTLASRTNVSATQTDVVVTTGQWSTGLWSGALNFKLDVYQGAGGTPSTKINSNGPLKVVAVTGSTRTLRLEGVAADITALDAYVLSNTDARIVIHGGYDKEMLGFFGVCAAASAGETYWGISSSTYELWRPTNFAVGGALTFDKVLEGLNRPAELGASGDFTLYVSVPTWQSLNDANSAFRRYVGAQGGKQGVGAEELTFFGQVGAVTIKPHIYMKEGSSLALCTGDINRIGATDITFDMPNNEGRMFRELETQAGSELRAYTLQAPFTAMPAQSIVCYSGITN